MAAQHYLNVSKTDLITNNIEPLSESELLKFVYLGKDLRKHKPIQYCLQESEFYGLKFKVTESVLIPRPETEELVHLILNELKKEKSILDIGTGSGCIPIAIKKNATHLNVSAIDISKEALAIAIENAKINAVDIKFEEKNILVDSLNTKYDIIVSNPPYIEQKEKVKMEKNVTEYEPHLALFVPDNDPLMFYKRIAVLGKKYLSSNGKLYFEIHENQSTNTVSLLKELDYKEVKAIKDINGKFRIIKAIK